MAPVLMKVATARAKKLTPYDHQYRHDEERIISRSALSPWQMAVAQAFLNDRHRLRCQGCKCIGSCHLHVQALDGAKMHTCTLRFVCGCAEARKRMIGCTDKNCRTSYSLVSVSETLDIPKSTYQEEEEKFEANVRQRRKREADRKKRLENDTQGPSQKSTPRMDGALTLAESRDLNPTPPSPPLFLVQHS